MIEASKHRWCCRISNGCTFSQFAQIPCLASLTSLCQQRRVVRQLCRSHPDYKHSFEPACKQAVRHCNPNVAGTRPNGGTEQDVKEAMQKVTRDLGNLLKTYSEPQTMRAGDNTSMAKMMAAVANAQPAARQAAQIRALGTTSNSFNVKQLAKKVVRAADSAVRMLVESRMPMQLLLCIQI